MPGSWAQQVLDDTGRKGRWTYSTLADPDAQHVLTVCIYCHDGVDATLGEGRAWFADHRRQAHSELKESGPPPPRRRRFNY